MIFFALGVIGLESLLVGLLLVERRRHRGAQLAIEEQGAYEQAIARLTADAARHAPDEAPRALEDALTRVAMLANASAATLVEYPALPHEQETRLFWPSRVALSKKSASAVTHLDTRDEFPLIADGVRVGVLELYRTSGSPDCEARLVRRLEAASEIIAGAIARARAQRAMRREEALNRAVLASVSSQIAIVDHSGMIIRVNDAWRHLAHGTDVERERDGFVGWNYLDECRRAEQRGCATAADVRRGIQAVLDRHAWPFRYEYHDSDQEDRWYELFVDRLLLSDGGAIVMHIDITERRLAEHRAEETRQQVAHMGRVALVGELAATISHELRQPLAAIRVNAEAGALVVARMPTNAVEAREIFDDIVNDDKRAIEVIEGVRRLLRKEQSSPSIIDLNQVSREAVRLLQRDAMLRDIRFTLSLDVKPLLLSGHPIELQQVVLNLAMNALEAASTSTTERSVIVRTASCVDQVELVVHDSGPGIALVVQDRLFESFVSTKGGGLGLGLAIVRSIVERHRGRIIAENHPLGGAVFRVRFPMLAEPAPRDGRTALHALSGTGTSPPV
jgi:C4-dicarboxylate-specific signal transduction histidine kinase